MSENKKSEKIVGEAGVSGDMSAASVTVQACKPVFPGDIPK
jgi:hypothetical protein